MTRPPQAPLRCQHMGFIDTCFALNRPCPQCHPVQRANRHAWKHMRVDAYRPQTAVGLSSYRQMNWQMCLRHRHWLAPPHRQRPCPSRPRRSALHRSSGGLHAPDDRDKESAPCSKQVACNFDWLRVDCRRLGTTMTLIAHAGVQQCTGMVMFCFISGPWHAEGASQRFAAGIKRSAMYVET